MLKTWGGGRKKKKDVDERIVDSAEVGPGEAAGEGRKAGRPKRKVQKSSQKNERIVDFRLWSSPGGVEMERQRGTERAAISLGSNVGRRGGGLG